MKIAIYDTGLSISDQILKLLDKYIRMRDINFNICNLSNSDCQLSLICKVDIAFICIDSSSQIEMLRKFCLNNSKCKIIIVAYIPDYRYAFQFHAFDFISLPICEKNFFHTLDDALYYLTHTSAETTVALRTPFETLNIKPAKIYYFERCDRKIVISTTQGEYIYIGRYTMKELTQKFKPYNFECPHKSFLVNLRHLKYIKGFDIYMSSGAIIPLAQKRTVEFKATYNKYIEKRFDLI